MERVLGVGGFFFRSADVDALSDWYARHLGVLPPPPSYDEPDWVQEGGPTVFAPFRADEVDADHIGPAGWGICFRVRDLEAMVAQLRGAGVAVAVDPAVYPNGRFAQLRDPEGNPIQLWQPTVAAPGPG